MKFSISIDRNGKGSPKSEFFSLNFIARGSILAPKEAQGKKGPVQIWRETPPGSRDVINRTGISGQTFTLSIDVVEFMLVDIAFYSGK